MRGSGSSNGFSGVGFEGQNLVLLSHGKSILLIQSGLRPFEASDFALKATWQWARNRCRNRTGRVRKAWRGLGFESKIKLCRFHRVFRIFSEAHADGMDFRDVALRVQKATANAVLLNSKFTAQFLAFDFAFKAIGQWAKNRS